MPDVDSAFRALADPTRRRIIELVALRGLTAGDIARHFHTTRPAVSQHLTVLRKAGLLEERR
jgi:DNA-binding transcriptional ArsR family regulator